MKYKEGISLINTPISQTVGVRLRQEIQKWKGYKCSKTI